MGRDLPPACRGWRASRRTVLKGAVLIGVVPALGFTTITCASALRDDPFTLGGFLVIRPPTGR